MKKEMCLGIILGMLGGAILICNVPAVKKAYEKGQQFVVKKVKTLCDKQSGTNNNQNQDNEPDDKQEKPKKKK